MSSATVPTVDNEPSLYARVFATWAVVWSPLVEDGQRRLAWSQLELPGDFDELAPSFLRAFHVAMPQPPAALLMHAALNRDGGVVREDFVRVMEYLDVEYEDRGRLPPDHLACACELLAVAIDADEPVITQGLREQYFGPWVAYASHALQGDAALLAVIGQFAEDLSSI